MMENKFNTEQNCEFETSKISRNFCGSKIPSKNFRICKTEEEWKKELGDRYEILRGKGTEAPFTGTFLYNKEEGVYVCGACRNKLFSSETKFDSGTGWPSFSEVISSDKIMLKQDKSLGMKRTEILCRRCGSHLGHVFSDGPKSTGKRFCINSEALNFVKKKNEK